MAVLYTMTYITSKVRVHLRLSRLALQGGCLAASTCQHTAIQHNRLMASTLWMHAIMYMYTIIQQLLLESHFCTHKNRLTAPTTTPVVAVTFYKQLSQWALTLHACPQQPRYCNDVIWHCIWLMCNYTILVPIWFVLYVCAPNSRHQCAPTNHTPVLFTCTCLESNVITK